MNGSEPDKIESVPAVGHRIEATKYTLIIKWDDLLHVQVGSPTPIEKELVRLVCMVVAERLGHEQIAEQVVKRQASGIVVATQLPGNSR